MTTLTNGLRKTRLTPVGRASCPAGTVAPVTLSPRVSKTLSRRSADDAWLCQSNANPDTVDLWRGQQLVESSNRPTADAQFYPDRFPSVCTTTVGERLVRLSVRNVPDLPAFDDAYAHRDICSVGRVCHQPTLPRVSVLSE